MSYNERTNAALNVALRRQYSTPLDVSSVFNSLDDFEAYVKQNTAYAPEGYSDEDKAFLQKINPYSYVGQVVAVIQGSDVKAYVITSVGENGTYKEVGSLPVGDDQSITVEDGKIQLVGFGDAAHGAVAQIKVTTNEEEGTTTKELVWTPISELVGGEMADLAQDVADHEERITALEGTETEQGTPVPGAVRTVTYTNGEYILEDTFGNEVSRIKIAEAVTNFAYHATYPGKDGKTYDNVLVLKLSDGEEQIIEIEDLVKIYDVEKNATEVQVTITPSTGPTDENDPSSDQPNVISAKLTDAVKANIDKGVVAHGALEHSEADTDIVLDSNETDFKVIIKNGAITTDKIDNEAVTETELEQSIVTKLDVISLDENKANPHIDGGYISGAVAEATHATNADHATTADSATNATNAGTATQVKNKFSINYGAANGKVEYDGSQAINMAFNTDMFNVVSSDAESKVMVSLNTTTVFVLDGGNAAGHTAA